eukprot:s1332_g17.t1
MWVCVSMSLVGCQGCWWLCMRRLGQPLERGGLSSVLFFRAPLAEIGKSSLKLIDFGLAKRFKPGEPASTKVLSGRYDEKVDITDGKHWKGVSADGKGFVQACLQKAPMARPSAGSCLKHRWIECFAEKDMDGPVIGLEIEGLAAYGRMHKLKKAVVTVAAQMIDELQRMFMTVDRNGDGTLTVVDVKDALDKAGIATPGNMEQLLGEADTDGSEVIDYTEFLAAALDKKVYLQEDIVWTAFKKFDMDSNGSIDMKELAQVIGDEQVVEAMNLKDSGDVGSLVHIFEQVDKNGDGKIDFDEFFLMIRGEEQGLKMSSLLEDGGKVQKKASLSAKILGSLVARLVRCHIRGWMTDVDDLEDPGD